MIILPVFLGLFASALLLVKSADILINNAEKLGLSLKIPAFLIGVIILSIGTSLPEFAAAIASVLKGHSALVVDNVMGSNIANIFLGLGTVALITGRHIQFKQNVFEVHFPILVMSVFALLISIWDRVVTAGEGSILLVIMLAYVWFLYSKHKGQKGENREQIIAEETLTVSPLRVGANLCVCPEPKANSFSWRYPFFITLGGLGLAVAAHFLVESLIKTAQLLGLAESVLAASLVSISTSLPEMVVGFKAARAGKYDVLVGNILGSNIFNIVLIISLTSFIEPLVVSEQAMQLLLPFFAGSIVIYWVSKKDQQITIQEGTAMTILYCLYLGKLYGIM